MQRALLLSLAVLIAMIGAGAWLASREATLVWITDHVQAGMHGVLRLDNVSGSLLRDIHVAHLEWHGDAMSVAADNATLQWAPLWILAGKLAFGHAEADSIAITRKPNADKSKPLPEKLHVPLRLRFWDTHAQ